MSDYVDTFLSKQAALLDKVRDTIAVRRAVVVSISGGKARVKPDDALVASDQYYPVLGDEYLAVGDEVALLPLGATPVVIGPLMRTARVLIPYSGVRRHHGPKASASLGAASGGGSIVHAGTDVVGHVNVTVGGVPTTGELFSVSFADSISSSYEVILTPRSINAGSSVWRVSSMSSGGFSVSIAAVPTGGSAVNFSYAVLPWVEE